MKTIAIAVLSFLSFVAVSGDEHHSHAAHEIILHAEMERD